MANNEQEDELPEDENLDEENGDESADDDDADPENEESGASSTPRRGRAKAAKAPSRGRSRAPRKAAPKASVAANSVGFDKKGKLEFNIGGLSSAKLAMIFAAGSTVLGGLWAGFQVYQQFLTMQKVTAAYVPPDLSGINSQISVLNERVTSVERLTKGNSEALNYLTGSIGSSINGTRQTVDAVSSTIRSSDTQNVAMQRQIIEQLRQQDQQQQQRLKDLEKWTDEKIKHVLANPLAKD